MRRAASSLRDGVLAQQRRGSRLLQSTVGQILGIVFVTLGATSALIAILLICLPPYALPPLPWPWPWPWPQASAISRIANALRNADPAQQDALLADLPQGELAAALTEDSAPCLTCPRRSVPPIM